MRKIIFNFGLLLAINAANAQEALIVNKTNGSSAESAVLDNIQRLSFSSSNVSVKMVDGHTAVYALDDVSKITFGDVIISDVTNPPATGLDVVVYVTPAGEIVVESPVAIQSLTLFNVDGKMLRSVSVVETGHVPSLHASTLPTGIYLLQIKTPKGIITKKLIINN